LGATSPPSAGAAKTPIRASAAVAALTFTSQMAPDRPMRLSSASAFPAHSRRRLYRDDAARRLSCCIPVAGESGRKHRYGQESVMNGQADGLKCRYLKQKRNKKMRSAKYGRNRH
jgi:hypothetical protein